MEAGLGIDEAGYAAALAAARERSRAGGAFAYEVHRAECRSAAHALPRL